MRTLFGYFLFFMAGVYQCGSQQGDQTPANSSKLSSLAAEEGRRGVYVFYTQSFLDRENKKASYRGSVYGVIQAFELKGCELKIEAMIVDRFSGTVGKAPTGELQDTFRYSVRLQLTSEIVSGMEVVEARPAQLGRNTHSTCDEDPSCTLHWLRIQAKRPILHEMSSVNDALEFDGRVDHFVVPISSAETGNQLIGEMRAIADSRCR